MEPVFEPAPDVVPTLSQTHTQYVLRPSNDPSLAYRIDVPKGWGFARDVPSTAGVTGRPERIGLFVPPSEDIDRGATTSVTVSATALAWEVDPLEWVVARLIVSGWRIVVRGWLDDTRFEVGAVFEAPDGDRVRRTTGQISAGKIVRVDVDTLVAAWPELHAMLWPCGEFFDVGDASPNLEARIRHEGPLVRFETPRTFQAVGGEGADGSVSWVVYSDEDIQHGVLLRVDARPCGATVEERQARVLRALALRGVLVDTRHQPLEPMRGSSAPQVALWQADARHLEHPLQLRVAHCDLDGVAVDVFMLAPRPGQFHLDWLRATRAPEIVVASLQADPSMAGSSCRRSA